MMSSAASIARSLIIPVAGLALAAGIAGCGSDTIKPAELVDFKPTGQVRVVWRASVGAAKAYVFTPGLQGGSLFAAAASGELVRLDGSTGKEAWSTDTKERLSGG